VISRHLGDVWETPTDLPVTFLRSPELQKFCKELGTQTLPELHPSFANLDHIRAILKKQRLLSYPKGQGVNGLIFEMKKRPEMKVVDALQTSSRRLTNSI
jgi:hypothetical protein